MRTTVIKRSVRAAKEDGPHKFDDGQLCNSCIPNSFHVWTMCGIPVYIHILLIIYVLYEVIPTNSFSWRWATGRLPGSGAGWYWLTCFTSMLMLFATVYVHELCHCWAAVLTGGSVARILLWPLGGLAYIMSSRRRCASIKVSAAGPAVHVPLAAIMAGILLAYGKKILWPFQTWTDREIPHDGRSFLIWVATEGFILQVVLMAFNLFIPMYPLDCGQIFVSTLMLHGVSAETAAFSCLCVSVPLALGLGGFGIWQMSQVHNADSTVASTITLIMSIWILQQCYFVYKCYVAGRITEHPCFYEDEEKPQPTYL